MSGTEYLLLAAVIVIPLVIAVMVTLWSLEQVRYRPKRRGQRRPVASKAEPGESGGTAPSRGE